MQAERSGRTISTPARSVSPPPQLPTTTNGTPIMMPVPVPSSLLIPPIGSSQDAPASPMSMQLSMSHIDVSKTSSLAAAAATAAAAAADEKPASAGSEGAAAAPFVATPANVAEALARVPTPTFPFDSRAIVAVVTGVSAVLTEAHALPLAVSASVDKGLMKVTEVFAGINAAEKAVKVVEEAEVSARFAGVVLAEARARAALDTQFRERRAEEAAHRAREEAEASVREAMAEMKRLQAVVATLVAKNGGEAAVAAAAAATAAGGADAAGGGEGGASSPRGGGGGGGGSGSGGEAEERLREQLAVSLKRQDQLVAELTVTQQALSTRSTYLLQAASPPPLQSGAAGAVTSGLQVPALSPPSSPPPSAAKGGAVVTVASGFTAAPADPIWTPECELSLSEANVKSPGYLSLGGM